MLFHPWTRTGLLVGLPVLAPAFLASCAHVKPEDLDSRLAEMRSELRQEMEQGDDTVGNQLTGIEGRVDDQQGRVDSMEQELERLALELDATVERMENALRFNMPVHFAFGEAEVTPEHQESLDRFATVIQEHYPGYLVTVEGFTDPVGSVQYNMELGLRRAQAVREYLTDSAGLAPERVRAVSYGESSERLVDRDAHGPGDAGRENRRVTLVVELSAGGSSQGGG